MSKRRILLATAGLALVLALLGLPAAPRARITARLRDALAPLQYLTRLVGDRLQDGWRMVTRPGAGAG